jgi:dTDP-4-amino-4,6-dideoxygalactose transaminase
MNVPFFDLNYGPEETAAAVEVLKSRWISMGPRCEELEKRFAAMHGSPHGIALANCTAALHLALRILDVGPGDEVIVPSLTFVATVSVVRMQGATPVFADITSLDDWTLSLEDVARKITPRTRAVIPMHYGGFGADMPRLCDLASRHNLKVVEDACHAPLGRRNGRFLGTYGDFACYSFYSNKNMATGEGGLMLTNHPDYAARARLLRAHGMTATAFDRERGAEFYDVVDWGYNYRLDDIRAAIGLAQLAKLEADLEHRARLVARYRRNLEGHPAIHIPFRDYPGRSSNYVFGVLTTHPDRRALREALKARGIGTSMHYPPVHQFACYRDPACRLPLTEEVGRREISLPLFFAMTLEQVDYVCEQLCDCLRRGN